jgi:hypothetical protein
MGWADAETKVDGRAHPEAVQQTLKRNGSEGLDPLPGVDSNRSGAIGGERWRVDFAEPTLTIPPAPAPYDYKIAPWTDEGAVGGEGEREVGAETKAAMIADNYLTLMASTVGEMYEVPMYPSYDALSKGSFDYDLATAAKATSPTGHDMIGGTSVVNPTEVEFNGKATEGHVM